MKKLPSFLTVPFHAEDVIAVESTRIGGVSQAPYDTLNLGLFTGDDQDLVDQNLHIICHELGIDPGQLAISRQVHGTEILEVTSPGRFDGFDAMITDRPDIYLGIGTADCCPVLILDPVRKAVGAVHAGWRGAAGSILPLTIARMSAVYGSEPADLLVYLGTCIGPSRYEIGPEVAEQFPPVFLQPAPADEKAYLDLKGCLMAQALASGIKASNMSASGYCTFDHADLFFSYRRDGVASGRMLSLIGWQSAFTGKTEQDSLS